MSKLSKEDFDEYLGNESFYNEEDKERFYRNIQSTKGWKRHWVPQTITLALLVGLFVIGVQFFQGNMPITSTDEEEATESKTDWSLWKEATSTKDVEAYYDATVPGYRIAREFNQVIDLNQKHALNDEITLYMDKAWYHEDKIYLFYSMDLTNEEVVEENHLTGNISDFLLYKEDGSTVQLETENSSPWSGMYLSDAFNNKLYRVATILLEDENQLSSMKELTASFSIDAHNEEATVNEVNIPVSYGSEVITSNDLNESHFSLHSQFNLKRFDMSNGKGYLFGSVQSDLGQKLESIYGEFRNSHGEKISVMERINPLYEGEFLIEIPELAENDISLVLDHLFIQENEESIQISIDVSDYDGSVSEDPVEKEMDQYMDEVNNMYVFLRSLRFDQQGVTIGITAKPSAQDATAKLFLISFVPKVAGLGFPNTVTALSDNGEAAKEHHFLYSSNEVGSDIHTFGLRKAFIVDANELAITIDNLLFGEEFNWEVEIPKQD
jgi:hypothetical protein